MNITDYSSIIIPASTIGGAAFALSGYLAATRKELDLMGIFIVAFLTANGGGVLRDLLIDRPPVMLQSTLPFWLTASVIIFAALFKLQHLDNLEKNWFFIISDSIGVVAVGATGALVAIEGNLHVFAVLTLALLTAVGGGIIRDILTNEVPIVLHSGFNGSVTLILALILYGLHQAAQLTPISIILVFVVALILRLIAHWRNWQLPKLSK
jgi:uncharacterized membrane protein YeiH